MDYATAVSLGDADRSARHSNTATRDDPSRQVRRSRCELAKLTLVRFPLPVRRSRANAWWEDQHGNHDRRDRDSDPDANAGWLHRRRPDHKPEATVDPGQTTSVAVPNFCR